ncbi:MAG: hypothetical protein R3B39_01180 [Candidatus Paceibacterota bacterium]
MIQTKGGIDEDIFNAVTESSLLDKQGMHSLTITAPDGSKLEYRSQVPGGGESIPKGGFRGGAEDIDHQPKPKKDRTDEVLEVIKDTRNISEEVRTEVKKTNKTLEGAKVYDEGEAEKKSKLTWGGAIKAIVMAASVVAILYLAYLKVSSSNSSSQSQVVASTPTGNTQVATPPAPMPMNVTMTTSSTTSQQPTPQPPPPAQKPKAEVSKKELKAALRSVYDNGVNLRSFSSQWSDTTKAEIVIAAIVAVPDGLSSEEREKKVERVSNATKQYLQIDHKDPTIPDRITLLNTYALHCAFGRDSHLGNNIDWLANSYVTSDDSYPTTTETEFSKGVKERIERLKEIIKEDGYETKNFQWLK